MADGPDRTDFWIQNFFLFRPFFDHFSNMMDQKIAPSPKNVNIKNQFLHAVNHVKKYLIFLQLLARASNGWQYSNFEN